MDVFLKFVILSKKAGAGRRSFSPTDSFLQKSLRVPYLFTEKEVFLTKNS